jgi:hypothetical protein
MTSSDFVPLLEGTPAALRGSAEILAAAGIESRMIAPPRAQRSA